LGQLIARCCAGANEGLVAPVTFILNMVHAEPRRAQNIAQPAVLNILPLVTLNLFHLR
jgi:hypothetical protein